MTDSAYIAAGYELNLDEYWQIILRRRWVILGCACFLSIFGWLITWMVQPPPLYASSASVKITESTDIAGLLLQNVSFSPVDNMSTQLALVKSYAVVQMVAKRLGLIPKHLTSAEIRANPSYMNTVLDLKEDVSAVREGSSSIITIKTKSSSAGFARDLAQAVAEEFRTYDAREKNKRVIHAKKFIQKQLVLIGNRLRKSEETLRDYREKNNLSNGESSKVMGKMVADLEQEFRRQSGHLNDLRFAMAQLRERIQRGGWDHKAVSVSGKVSEYFDLLNKRLVEMALKRTRLLTVFTKYHPEIKELNSQAADILASMVGELGQQVRMTRQRMNDLQKSIGAAERKFRGVPEQVLELNRLERNASTNTDLYSMLEKKYQEVQIRAAEKVEEVSLLHPALVSHRRINSVHTGRTIVAGFILGLALGLIISLVLESLDTSAGSMEEVESSLEVPVIGSIQHLAHEDAVELFSGTKGLASSGDGLERQMRLVAHFAPASAVAESYRGIRTNLLFSQLGKYRVIVITSATLKEGKSMVSSNLAMVVAQQGARVLLIDANMRDPVQHKLFGLGREPGLSDYLLGQLPWQKATRHISDVMLGDFGVDHVLMTPGLDQLDILTSGRSVANSSDLLAIPAMTELLGQARQEYDMVIVDMPPLLHTADANVVAGEVDGVLLVYHMGTVTRGALRRAKKSVDAVGGNVAGVVLNGIRGEFSPDFSKGSKVDRYYGRDERAEGHASVLRRCSDWIRARGREGQA